MSLRKLRSFIDYYLFFNRMNKIILDVLEIVSQRNQYKLVAKTNSCLLIHKSRPFAIQCDWSNHYSTEASIQIYCMKTEATAEDFSDVSYHQYGTRMTPMSWVWLPRLDELWPTSYQLKYLSTSRLFFWKICRVGKGTNSASSDHMSRADFKDDLVRELESFLPKIEPVLFQAIDRDERSFTPGDRLRLLTDWGQDMKSGDTATVKAVSNAGCIEVVFDRMPNESFDVWGAYLDVIRVDVMG